MKKYIFPVLAVLMLVGCTTGDDVNRDTNSAYTTIPSTLITYAQKEMCDYVNTPNVNENNFRLTMQYWTETTYVGESNYDFAARSVSDQVYSDNYVNVLNNLVKAKGLIETIVPTASEAITWDGVKKNQLAMIDIMIVYTYQNLVDTFGNIPYTDSNNLSSGVVLPKYDDAATIYSNLILRLDTDINNLDTSAASTTASSTLGASDLYYGGSVAKWKKFGSSLLLKLAISIADSDPTLAKATAADAIGYGVITAAADNCQLAYLAASPNFNPVYENVSYSGRNDFVGGKPFVDYLNSTGDTRITKYFKPQSGTTYVGQTIGTSAPFANFSAPGTFAYTATTPGVILNATETLFYLTEASARWNDVGAGTPAINYANAVTSSFTDWGLTSDAASYILTHPYNSGNWKKSVGEQAWVAMYNQPLQSWNFWRRLDFPVLSAAPAAVPVAEGKIPVRLVYSPREASTNGANVAAAATAIGGDKMTTKIFWDKF